MQERILEILGHLLSYFQHDEGDSSLEGISVWLRDDGYSSSEISEALSVFCSKFQVPLERFPAALKRGTGVPLRIRNRTEREVIGGDAYGYLLQLHRLRLVNADEFERILERAIMLGGRTLGRDDIRSVAASVIFPSAAGNARLLHRDGGMIH